MKKMLAVLSTLALAAPVFAQVELNPTVPDPDQPRIHMRVNPEGSARITRNIDDIDENGVNLTQDYVEPGPSYDINAKIGSQAASNLVNHGGPTITRAHVVLIFWGPTWASGGSDSGNATAIINFRNQFGTSSHYAMLTQYSSIQQNNLQGSQPDWFDTTNALPSTGNVTDSVVQAEVKRYISAHGYDGSAIYEVFTPNFVPGSTTKHVYSSDGSSTSCGGPGLAYCAYHSSYSSGSGYVKYSIEPYPSCSGCQASGWTTAQNMEHFVTHETREAVTDALGTAWYDASGNEADDKCAWTGLFIAGGYGYQPEWSNSAHGCVQ